MRDLLTSPVNKYRILDPTALVHFGGWSGDHSCGLFMVPASDGETIRIIASSGHGWDHVSVSLRKRLPRYREMCKMKYLFFEDTETAMQLHVPMEDHINVHPHTLHLWRPTGVEIPRPPAWMV